MMNQKGINLRRKPESRVDSLEESSGQMMRRECA